jgi:hypothetical protein
VFVLTSQEKWTKAKNHLKEVWDMLENNPDKLSRKRLEQIQGLLQYVVQTYTSLSSYLIGFHMTIDAWRPGRDHLGWRMAQSLWEGMDKAEEEWARDEVGELEIPTFVKAVPQFKDDIVALQRLMSCKEPPLKRARCSRSAKCYDGFDDASGSGFGATIQIDGEIHYEYGQWCSQVTEESSSNWRELDNLVEALERIVVEQDLRGSEIFIFTDNSTAERAETEI